jgi:hypothetical protein
MAVVDPSRTQQWQGFKVFKLDPEENDPLIMFKWQLTKGVAHKGMVQIHFSG